MEFKYLINKGKNSTSLIDSEVFIDQINLADTEQWRFFKLNNGFPEYDTERNLFQGKWWKMWWVAL